MRIKNRNLIATILQSVAVLLLFVPGFWAVEFWKNLEWGHWTQDYIEHVSMVSGFDYGFAAQKSFPLLGWLALVFALLLTALLILQLLSKGEKQNMKLAAIGPFIELGLIVLYAAARALFGSMTFDERSSYFRYGFGFLFFIIVALLIALCILSLATYRQYKNAAANGISFDPEAEEAPKNNAVIATGNPAQLKELKELLDMGAITQEEFDAKKKQILGL